MADALRFRPRGQQDLAPSGQAERARANVAALQVLREVQSDDRPATAAEQQVLARWSGWGALPLVFDTRPTRKRFDSPGAYERALARWESFSDVRAQVRALLSDAEWDAASRNVLNAHYTDAAFVQVIWDVVRDLGFDGGTVLEPGSGAGNFIGLAPDDVTHPVRMTGVERDPTTAAISQLLYPDATVITSAMEDVRLPRDAFDAAVGNVPFGSFQPYDPEYNPNRSLSIHDLFVLKALASTRPGGVVALITSRYTLDAADPDARQQLHALGDLVGAVRLPVAAHRAAAGTDVVTDVLFLRRRAEHEQPGNDGWLTSEECVLDGRDEPVRVNSYFTAHPEHVLGRMQTRLGQFGPELTVVSEARTAGGIAAQMRAAARDIVAAFDPPKGSAQPTDSVPAIGLPGQGAEGSLALDASGTITIIDGGRPVPLEVHPEQRDRLVQMVDLKQKVQALYAAEAATAVPGETAELAELRGQVRDAYRAYRRRYPPLSKPRQARTFTPKDAAERARQEGLASVPADWRQPTAFGLIDDDPDASLLFSLDVWDEQTGAAVEQPILTRRMLEPRVLPEHADGIEEAIALAMEYDGGALDMNRVAALLGVDEAEAIQQAQGLAFKNPYPDGEPEGQGPPTSPRWEARSQYLSGDVRTKLQQAIEAARWDPSYRPNVAALQQVQPTDLTPSEIKARVGAPWIPVADYTQFLRDLGFEKAEVRHAGGTIWEVEGADRGDLSTSEWGTPERNAQVLFETLLSQAESTIRVTRRDADGNIVVNQQATAAAREKARLLATEFEDWVWRDPERADRLVRLYNETFNRLVLPEYDTSPLTLPGAMLPWPLRPHQNAAVRRIVFSPTVVLGHVVGAGKTATMAAAAMELRRTGLARKPAMVVPNHMLKEITREFRQLYPTANLLAINASDLHHRRRTKFMARIAGGDWDAVILTHEAFNRIPVRPSTERDYMDAELVLLREQLDRARESGMSNRTLRDIEDSLANAEARIKEQLDKTSEDGGVFFEDTGIDYLFVDESHAYKNLRTVSAIPGATIQGSNKATKLHMVMEHLRAKSTTGRVATLATGTPIANSVTEAYVLMRYMDPQALEVMGVKAFDNWAATFGEVVTQIEPDPKGAGYKQKSRFARFFNVPELMRAYLSFADVQLAEDLKLPTPPVRTDAGGQRGEVVLIPATQAQRDFFKSLPHQPWINDEGGVLKALGLGLRASVDMRLVGGHEEQGSKLDSAAEQIAQIWAEHKDVRYPVSLSDPTPQDLPGALQLVFLDEGTPGSSSQHPVDLYADLRDKLADRGVPREQIRFIHEASNDLKKEKLFADARAGRVAVLIGSTEKMGTGTNVQNRAVALHHLSYPWRPADMAQRDGRIERQGNLNDPRVPGTPDDVRILYYVTERSFDEFRLNHLTRKAKFIGQLQRRDFNVREIEDIGGEAVNFGLLTALSSGDPTIMEHAQATAERARLQGLARSWERDQDRRARQIREADAFIEEATTALTLMRAAAESRIPTAGDAFSITVAGVRHTRRETAATALGRALTDIAKDIARQPGEHVPLGTLGGQDFHAEIVYGVGGARMVRLRFAWGHVVAPGNRTDRAQWPANKVDTNTGRGALQALENFLNHLDSDIVKLETEVQQQRQQRAEIAANVRDIAANPYRDLARSKEREEVLLGRLVIANEKRTNLAEQVASYNDEVPDQLAEQLAEAEASAAHIKEQLAAERQRQRELSDREQRAAAAPQAGQDESPHGQAADPAQTPGAPPDPQPEERAPTQPAPDVLELLSEADVDKAGQENVAAAAAEVHGDATKPAEPSPEQTAESSALTGHQAASETDDAAEPDAPPYPAADAPSDMPGDDAVPAAPAPADPALPPGMTIQRRDELIEAMTMLAPAYARAGAGDPARYAVEAIDATLAPTDTPVTREEWDWAEAWAQQHPEIADGSLSAASDFWEHRRRRIRRIAEDRRRDIKRISTQARLRWQAGDLDGALQLIGEGERLYPEDGTWARARTFMADTPLPAPAGTSPETPGSSPTTVEVSESPAAASTASSSAPEIESVQESAEMSTRPAHEPGGATPEPAQQDMPPDIEGQHEQTPPQPVEPSALAGDADTQVDGGPMPEQSPAVAEPATGPMSARVHIDDSVARPTVSGTRYEDTELRAALRANNFRWRGKRMRWEYVGPAADRDTAVAAIRSQVAEMDRAAIEQKAAKPSFPPTAQQQAIIDAAVAGQNVAVQALAGTGKTSTLRMVAEAMPDRRILYIAFNKSIAEEARQSMSANVTALTFNAYALRQMRGGPYAAKLDRLGKGARHPQDIARLLNVEPVEYLDHEGEPQVMAAGSRVQLAKAVVAKFRLSSDPEISEAHLPDALPSTMVYTPILETARQIWQNIADPGNAHLLDGDRAVQFDHDDYFKLWALTAPRIDTDVIFFDEAQDINDVQRDVVQSQPAQTLVVGDTYQSIYGFRGAKDALKDWPADITLPLTQSWRFGPAIAERGDDFLRLLGAPFELTGNPAMNSRIGVVDHPDAILCRTNVGAVSEVSRAVDEGKKVALVGGSSEISKLAIAAKDLKAGRGTNHPELSRFTHWWEVEEAAQEERALQPFVRLIDQHGPDKLLNLVGNLVDEDAIGDSAPDVVVSTAHKAKGREWRRVRIAGDFHTPKYAESGEIESLPSAEELRLSYVAVTRGRDEVSLGSLEWIEDAAVTAAPVRDQQHPDLSVLSETAETQSAPEPGPAEGPERQPSAVDEPATTTADSNDAPAAAPAAANAQTREPEPAAREQEEPESPEPAAVDVQAGQDPSTVEGDADGQGELLSIDDILVLDDAPSPGQSEEPEQLPAQEAVPVASSTQQTDQEQPVPSTDQLVWTRDGDPADRTFAPAGDDAMLDEVLREVTEVLAEQAEEASTTPATDPDPVPAVAEPPVEPAPEPASADDQATDPGDVWAEDMPDEDVPDPQPAPFSRYPDVQEAVERLKLALAERADAGPARDAAPLPPPAAADDTEPSLTGVEDVLAGPLAEAQTHLAPHTQAPEWRRVAEVANASRLLGRTIVGAVGSYRREVANDIRVRGLWRAVSARCARVIAASANALANRLDRGAALAIKALRRLGRAANDYADQLQGNLPSGRTLQTTASLQQSLDELDAMLDQPAPPVSTPPAGAVLLENSMNALHQAFTGARAAVQSAGAAVTSSPAWQRLTNLWNGAASVVDRVRQGALRFERDAFAMGFLRAVWTRTCETLSWGARQAMEHMADNGGRLGPAWQALRLLHHTAEETIAHLREQLPRDQHVPLGTYDPPSIAEAAARALREAPAPQTSPAASTVPAPRPEAEQGPQYPADQMTVIQEMIEVLDAIDLARQHNGELDGGFGAVATRTEQAAERMGLRRIGQVGDAFDPRVHEGVGGATPDHQAPDKPVAVQILRPGYMVGDSLIRPASVRVGSRGDLDPEVQQARELMVMSRQGTLRPKTAESETTMATVPEGPSSSHRRPGLRTGSSEIEP